MADPICEKIQAPKTGLYQGAFVADNVSEAKIEAFKQMSGTDVDIALKFLAFATGLRFPTREAKAAAKKGGTLFIKLEPWSWRGKNDKSFTLENILKGRYDRLLKRFAEGAKRFGKPVFASFAHEMNGDWYPWSGNPSQYVKAFRYVHDKISKEYGACNITWVWNPNVDKPSQPYYPGDQYVDWVALDGYNWSGTSPIPAVFTGLSYLKTLNKPIMIGEFACAKDNASCLSNFINFVTQDKAIKAFIYFNKDKEKKWAISKPAEKTAYRSAIKRHENLFLSSIKSAKTAPVSAVAGGPRVKTYTSLPPGFDTGHEPPIDLINKNKKKIELAIGRVRDNNRMYRSARQSGDRDLILNADQYTAANFSEYIIQWMLERENGNPSLALLNDSLGFLDKASPYWKTKAAFLIASGSPTPYHIRYLKRLGFARNINPRNFTRPSKAQRFNLFKEIQESYISHRRQQFEPVDPLLKGEMELQLANFSPDKRIAKTYLDLAEKSFDEIMANPRRSIRNKIYRVIHKRMKYLKGARTNLPAETAREFKFYQGQSRALKAQVLLFKAGDIEDPTQNLSTLQEAYDLLKLSVPNLEGLHLQQVKRLAAECLIRMAFTLKDYENSITIPEKVKAVLRELWGWEIKSGTVSTKSYEALLHAAQAFISGVPKQSVLGWENEYNKIVTQESKRPLWLKQISLFAELWQAKMEMVIAGEIKDGKPKDFIKLQRNKLAEAEQTLRGIIQKTKVVEPEAMAEAKRTLAENLARQGFVLLDLGDNSYTALFTKAKALLDEAVREGRPEVKAEANLWKAKILLVEAGKKASKRKRESTLAEGLRLVQQSFGKDALGGSLLKGTVLSSAYQNKGDLLAALKRFDEAKQALEEAIDKFPRNFFAHASLGDVLNWQGNHGDAIEAYKKVPEKSSAYPHAQLGLAESHMRKNEDYLPGSIKNLEEFAKKVFDSQPPASPLIPRALQGLIEAYRTDEDLQERIIYIGKNLLGETVLPGNVKADLKGSEKATLDNMLGLIDNPTRAALEDKFRSELFLRTAETLLWRKKFDDVLTLLKDIPAGLKSDFEIGLRKAPELQVLRDLIRAEAKMRMDKDADPFKAFLASSYDPKKTAIAEKDPDLAARIVLDHIESFTLEKDWEEAVKAAQDPIIPLSEMQKLFSGRKLSYEKYRFELRFKLADAYIGDKDFGKAEAELKSIKKDVEELKKASSQNKKEAYLVPTYRRLEARAYLVLGDLYSYRWSKQNYNASRKMYEVAVKLMEKDASKKSRIILAKAYLGLGEIFRFGKKLQKEPEKYYNNEEKYEKSKEYYKEAEKVALKLPEKSDDRWEILSKIYLGLALLEQEDGDPASAWLYMRKSKMCLAKLAYPPDELEDGVSQAKQNIFDPNVILNWNRFSDIQATEDRFAVTLQLPFPFWRETMQDQLVFYAQNFTDTRLDASGRSIVNSTYLGARFRPAIFKKLLALDFKGKIASGMLGEENSDTIPQNFRRPNFSFAGSFWSKYFTASASYDLNLEESRLNTLYADGMLNLAFTKNPFAQIRLGGIFSNYHFTYWGDFRKRYFAGFGVNYELDAAALINALSYNTLQLRLSGTLPIYEYEREAKHGYMIEDKLSHRFIHNGAPFRIDGCLQLNLGKLGVIEACGGGNIQNTPEYQYSNWNVGVGYRNSIY